jgi:nucleoside-diphosphate-sugar epimerase
VHVLKAAEQAGYKPILATNRRFGNNEKIERTGFKPIYSLEMGIKELIKGYTILRNSRYANRIYIERG